ncbi:UTRA domain-containing protein [Actinoplanes sp. M2I2]|uniref:UTRA domain-containing protein n=1 Tax=Actinoplanes sp. M2I2 TaxID=1734444 RepID=UPI0020213068|nr:UTRA domain-containing protein [Actinoplanes sp. M2I2]
MDQEFLIPGRLVEDDRLETPASEDIAEALSVPPGAAVLTRARRFVVDDRIVMTATSHLPLDVVAAVPAVAYTGPGLGGIYVRMAVHLRRVIQ